MVLRVKIEIVPFGEESEVYELYRFDIFNKGYANKATKYGVIELNKEKNTGALWEKDIKHQREKGAIELVRKVLAKYLRV